MEDRVKELEMEVIGLKFITELLMDKLGVTNEEIKKFAKRCLENLEEEDKKSEMYYFLIGTAYQEKAAELLQKEAFKEKNENKDKDRSE